MPRTLLSIAQRNAARPGRFDMLVIGLTGGIATGKTTVSQILRELGAEVLDADRVGHEAYLPDTVTYNDVVATFGSDIVKDDRQIDRAKLGAIVFSDPANMKKLTDIMWPRMYHMVGDRIEEQRGPGHKGDGGGSRRAAGSEVGPPDRRGVGHRIPRVQRHRAFGAGQGPERGAGAGPHKLPDDQRRAHQKRPRSSLPTTRAPSSSGKT